MLWKGNRTALPSGSLSSRRSPTSRAGSVPHRPQSHAPPRQCPARSQTLALGCVREEWHRPNMLVDRPVSRSGTPPAHLLSQRNEVILDLLSMVPSESGLVRSPVACARVTAPLVVGQLTGRRGPRRRQAAFSSASLHISGGQIAAPPSMETVHTALRSPRCLGHTNLRSCLLIDGQRRIIQTVQQRPLSQRAFRPFRCPRLGRSALWPPAVVPARKWSRFSLRTLPSHCRPLAPVR
jgi:hypothetical protein